MSVCFDRIVKASPPATTRKVAMLPGPQPDTEWKRVGNGHLRALAAELGRNGWTVHGLEPRDFFSPSCTLENSTIVHIHWTEALTLQVQQPYWVKALTSLQTAAGQTRPHLFLQRFARRILRPIAARRPLVYQVHDLDSNWLEPARAHLLDRAFKLACLREAHAWVVHESSSLSPLDRIAPRPASIAICPLGDYAGFHGPPIAGSEARRRLGLPENETIFLYAGYAGTRRNPAATATAFTRLGAPNARLIIASRNARRYLPTDTPRIEVRDEFLENETVRDLYCAADWIVMPGRAYLNSAVVRTALSYARPVICIEFGSQSDMARDAALWLEDDSEPALHRQLSRALVMPADEYQRYSRAAAARSAERSWSESTRTYVSLLEQLRESAARQPSSGARD